jgi:hypothetical protein
MNDRSRRDICCRECGIEFADQRLFSAHALNAHSGQVECACGGWILASSMRAHELSQRHNNRLLERQRQNTTPRDDRDGGGGGGGGNEHDNDDAPLPDPQPPPPPPPPPLAPAAIDTRILDGISQLDDVAGAVARFFETARRVDVPPRSFDMALITRVVGPRVGTLTDQQRKYDNELTVELGQLIVNNKCSRELSDLFCEFANNLNANVPKHWATVDAVLRSQYAPVPVKHDDELNLSYRDPLDLIASVLRERYLVWYVLARCVRLFDATRLQSRRPYRFPYDALAFDSVCSRPFYLAFAQHFSAAINAGFELQAIDVYFDEYELTKAHKM